MPLLSLTGSINPEPAAKTEFFESVADTYVDIMDSKRSFLSVSYDRLDRSDLWLGRADPEEPILLLEADIRKGRPTEQRREFAVAFMDAARDRFGLPRENLKVVFTEHEGPHLMGYDRVGGSWDPE
ncbi:MAG: 4-oxalocrotonate tautomerase family protein [Salinirussus sp.]